MVELNLNILVRDVERMAEVSVGRAAGDWLGKGQRSVFLEAYKWFWAGYLFFIFFGGGGVEERNHI